METENKEQTILVVDDEPGNVEILIELLRAEYKIRIANNGEKALKILMSDNPPDLVLLDVVMPGMDGYEVCRRLKADSRTNKIPVIFLSAKNDEKDEIKGFEVGAVDYVTKPFKPVIIKARVQSHAELKKHRDFLETRSLRDGLTGISNRRRFDEFLESIWELACRKGTNISLIMLDIDHFKKYNDNYGHQAGDTALSEVAQALENTLRRKTDLIARYGGEEFACVLPATDLAGAILVAEKFREAVNSLKIPHEFSSAGRFISISQGAASLRPIKGSSSRILIKAADESLYLAKKNGRNRVSYMVCMDENQ